jgi:hypothetical protein
VYQLSVLEKYHGQLIVFLLVLYSTKSLLIQG